MKHEIKRLTWDGNFNEISSTRDLKDFFSICDVENTILTYPPHSILSLLGYVKKFVDITLQCFALLPQVNFPTNDFNFHLR